MANQRIGQTATDNSWLNYPAATPGTISYTSNALNQYTAVGTVSPTYDNNGNLTSDGTFTYGYDARSRLTSAVGAGNTAAYTFDAQGRRKTKTVNGTTTVFVTDPDNREVLEYDGSSGAILRWYAYGLGSNNVLNQTNVAASTRSALIPDIQGSIIATLDSATGSLTKASYSPYGGSTNAPGSFGYTAQRIDPETNGLYYYRTRHYSPLLGRFLQTDTSGTKGGVNLYAYAKNDPLNLVDITGRAPDAPNSYAAQVPAAASNVSDEIDAPEEETNIGSNLPVPYYPPNSGFAATPDYTTLQVGTTLGRYGYAGGRFLAPAGTPAPSLSLPYGSESLPYNEYSVVNPLLVLSGQAAPAFGQFGGGIQYLPVGEATVQDLINRGFIE